MPITNLAIKFRLSVHADPFAYYLTLLALKYGIIVNDYSVFSYNKLPSTTKINPDNFVIITILHHNKFAKRELR